MPFWQLSSNNARKFTVFLSPRRYFVSLRRRFVSIAEAVKTKIMSLSPAQISAMVDLFKDTEEKSDSDDDTPLTGPLSKLGPGNIGPAKSSQAQSTEPVSDSKNIWSEAEVPEGSEYDSVYDPRPQPEYDIVYSQAVTSEDIFLQMGNKTPMTSSCENMTIKIKLPETKMAEVELDVKPKFLDCRTPNYKLGLHLPHPVDQKSGKAQWDAKNETLSVTLRIVRDYDIFNF